MTGPLGYRKMRGASRDALKYHWRDLACGAAKGEPVFIEHERPPGNLHGRAVSRLTRLLGRTPHFHKALGYSAYEPCGGELRKATPEEGGKADGSRYAAGHAERGPT